LPFFFFLVVLGFELRASHLLGRCSTSSAIPSAQQRSYISSHWHKICVIFGKYHIS
jgi:hypothetical protein